MARDNYYILLDLDPSITDISIIEDRIKKKQREWSSQRNHPTLGNQMKNNLDQLKKIREIMLDDSSHRDIERKEAILLRQQQKQKADSDLTNLINSLVSIKGYISETEFQKLVKRFKPHFDDKEIRSRIEPHFQIRKDSSKTQKVKKDFLEKTTLQSIENELKIIQKKNLYEFLDINPKSTLLAIQNKIKKKVVELQKNNNKNAALTAQNSLIGHCKIIFHDEEERMKYDNSLSFETIRELEKDIDILCSSEEVSADSWSNIIKQARSKGIPKDEAEECIINYAKKKGWPIQSSATTTEDKTICCGNCRAFNDAKSKKCVQCKEDLYIQCIRCKTLNASEYLHCSNCGFSLADYFYIIKLLRDADKKIVQHNWKDAKQALDEAELYWPNYDKILTIKEKLNIEKEKETQELSEIEDLVSDSRLYQAKKRIQQLKQEVKNHQEIYNLEKQIEHGIQKANEYISQAEKFENSGDTDKAIDKYLYVLKICQDNSYVKNRLADHPPPPPSNLFIDRSGVYVTIKWDAEQKGRVTFRVLRKKNVPPEYFKDGTIVADETSDLFYEDSDCEPGIGYYYSVYSIRAGVHSKQSAVTHQPVLYAPDLKELCITPGDQVIHFEWQPVINAACIEIWKKEGKIPDKPNDGISFQIHENCFDDNNVENGHNYGYLIFTLFEYNNQIIRSTGLRRQSIPKSPPEPITDLNFSATENTIQLFWTPPQSTEKVYIIKSEKKLNLQLMDVISGDDMNELGEQLVITNENSTSVDLYNDKFIFFTPISQQGDKYIVGHYIMFSNIEDVSEISATTIRGQIKVQWFWPKDVNFVAVLLKETSYASHPNDDTATKIIYSREKYQRKGGLYYDAQNIDILYITIFSAIKEEIDWQFSSGVKEGCRVRVAIQGKVTLRYYIRNKKRLGLFQSKDEYELVLLSDRKVCLPHLVLKARKSIIPNKLDDGSYVLSIDNGLECYQNRPISLPFKSNGLPRNAKAKLFAVNNDDYSWLKLSRSTKSSLINP